MLKIDCHTHIFSPEIRGEYFSKASCVALVMQFPEKIMKNPDCVRTVREDPRLFLCPCVDLKEPIKPQLDAISPVIGENKVVGLKIYTSYQRGRADDERLFPVYEFCAENKLSVTFHTGICAMVLPSDQTLDDSDAKYIAHAAELFPNVNFIAAHMDDPRYEQCASLMETHKNLFADFCGVYETGAKECEDVDGTVEVFRQAIKKHPLCRRQMLYATDFCPPIKLSVIDEYDYTLKNLFDGDLTDIYHDNALRAFPRLREFLK